MILNFYKHAFTVQLENDFSSLLILDYNIKQMFLLGFSCFCLFGSEVIFAQKILESESLLTKKLKFNHFKTLR